MRSGSATSCPRCSSTSASPTCPRSSRRTGRSSATWSGPSRCSATGPAPGPIEGMQFEIHRLEGRTPVLFAEIPPANGGPADTTVFLYGHLDKQPEVTGWREGLDPWTPVMEGDNLYGRGGADDGYATFAAFTAVEAAQRAGFPHARLRRAHRGERGERQPRPARPRRGPGRPHRHPEPHRVPGLGLPRLRPPVAHHLAAGPARRPARRRGLHRGRPLRRRQRRDPLDLPDRPHDPVPPGGRGHRRDPARRAAGGRCRPTGSSRPPRPRRR